MFLLAAFCLAAPELKGLWQSGLGFGRHDDARRSAKDDRACRLGNRRCDDD
jgi:hypothetical protein